ADSISKQKTIDQFLLTYAECSAKQKFIARLTWHKGNNTLPKGVPDPSQERLTPENLQKKMDESLSEYIHHYVEKYLNKISIKQFNEGILGVIYFLEGKDLLIKLLIFLISEFGIKQLADPHLFALSFLNSNGIEVMDYELDGFGRDKRSVI